MKDSILQHQNCPVCKNSNNMGEVPYQDSHHPSSKIFDNLSIKFCRECGFGFSTPEIDDEAVNYFYTHIYRGSESPHFINFSSLSKPVSYNYRSLAQLILARHFVEFKPDDVFVDIGPGRGESFMSAAHVLATPKMCAVELSDGAADAYKRIYGVNSFKSISELVDFSGDIKIILSSHSLEHFKLQELEIFFQGIKDALCSDGVFIAEVPHVNMRIHSQMRSGDSPHFLFFSKESLKKMFESFGFDVLFLDSCGPSYDAWWGSQIARKEKREKKSSLLKNVLRSGFNRIPMLVKNTIKKIHYVIDSGVINFGVDDFSYGGNRTCLRVVACPKKDFHEFSKSE